MEVFNEQVIDYLNENNTTIDEILNNYNEQKEKEKNPSQDYIREINKMSDKEKYFQMKSEQQIDMLINMKKMFPKNDIYLDTKSLSDAIQMYQKMNKIKEQIN
tara:strand:- start:344 stop:652 length:309 start_codon:yes stop_codon:yes gene_type:complete